MANINYDSPTSFRNDIGFKPDGFLGGALFNEHENDYRQATQASQAMKGLSYLEEQNKMKDYNLDEPVRASKRLSDMATNDATSKYIGDIKGGEAALGQVNMQTIKQQVGEQVLKLASGQRKEDQDKFRQHLTDIDELAPVLNTLKPNDLKDKAKYDYIREKKPDLGLPEEYNPSELRHRTFVASAYMDAKAKRDQAAEMAKQAEETKRAKQTSDAQERIHAANNAATIEAAKISANAKLATEKPEKEGEQVARWRDTIQAGPSQKDGGAAYEAAVNGLKGHVSTKLSGDPELKSLANAYGLSLLNLTPKGEARTAEIKKQMTDRKEALTQEAIGLGGRDPGATTSNKKGVNWPKPGTIIDGFKYNEGDPSLKSNWEKQ
jgi:chemotaxis protein histidine kinase CheA